MARNPDISISASVGSPPLVEVEDLVKVEDLVEVEDLHVRFASRHETVEAVNGKNLTIFFLQ